MFELQQFQKSYLPRNWRNLTHDDLNDFIRLWFILLNNSRNVKRGEKLDEFVDGLKRIRNYVFKNKNGIGQRSIACGIMFLKFGVAIQISDFEHFLCKSRSSINCSFQQEKYLTAPFTESVLQEIFEIIPSFRNDPGYKMWCYRENKKLVPILKSVPFTLPEFPKHENRKNSLNEGHSQPPCPIKFKHRYIEQPLDSFK